MRMSSISGTAIPSVRLDTDSFLPASDLASETICSSSELLLFVEMMS